MMVFSRLPLLLVFFVNVGAFQPINTFQPHTSSPTKGIETRKPLIAATFYKTVTTISSTGLQAKKADKNDSNDDKTTKSPSMLDIIKEKPGTLVAAPFVVIVGVDLLANIFFLAKRTVEYFAFGKLPSTEVWFSDSFFL